MPESVQTCPLCGRTDSRAFDRRIFRGREVHNRICPGCGLVFQSPRMSRQEADDFYEGEYRRLYQGGEEPVAKDIAVQRARASTLVDFMRPYIRQLSSHLDIGCSTGIFMQFVSRVYADTAVGIEPGKAYRDHASREGLKVYKSLGALKEHHTSLFNLVSMLHVLEHMADPVAYLVDLRKDILAPAGWLLVEVPNLYAHDSFEIAHLVSFSAHTLGQTLYKAGYEIVLLEKHGRPRSKMIPYYLTVLARPLARPGDVNIRPEKMVSLKRRLGLVHRRLMARLFHGKVWQTIE